MSIHLCDIFKSYLESCSISSKVLYLEICLYDEFGCELLFSLVYLLIERGEVERL